MACERRVSNKPAARSPLTLLAKTADCSRAAVCGKNFNSRFLQVKKCYIDRRERLYGPICTQPPA
jgi:hypothetical protein